VALVICQLVSYAQMGLCCSFPRATLCRLARVLDDQLPKGLLVMGQLTTTQEAMSGPRGAVRVREKREAYACERCALIEAECDRFCE
jgi:hypothetical protein